MIGYRRLCYFRFLHLNTNPIFHFTGKTCRRKNGFFHNHTIVTTVTKIQQIKHYSQGVSLYNTITMPPKRKVTKEEVATAKIEDNNVEEVTTTVSGKSKRNKKEVPVTEDIPVPEKQAGDGAKKGKRKAVENGDKKNKLESENVEDKKPSRAAKKAAETKEKEEVVAVTKEVKTRKKKATEDIPEPEQKNGSGEGPSKKAPAAKTKAAKAKKEEEPPVKKGKVAAKKEKPAKKETEVKEKKTKTTKPKKDKDDEEENTGGLMNQTKSKWEKIDFSCDTLNPKGQNFNTKITSWNVDGIRAWLKKDGLNILKYCKPDVFCLQETKISEESLPDELKEIEGYKTYWCSSQKNGYAGVALFSKIEPLTHQYGIGIEEHDEEGRCITAEFSQFYVVSVYVPNAGRKLVTLDKRLDWNTHFKNYINTLNKKKPVIICGDMNVAHNEIDLANPKTNMKNAGFTREERDGMTDFLGEGYIDTYRHLYPDGKDVYTFWSYMSNARNKNIGWRLDYFIVSEKLKDNICDNIVHDEVYGSDHCPLTLFLTV